MMMRRVYGYGIGGKHRDNAEARLWRALTAQIARQIHASHPTWDVSLIVARAELHARVITHELNRAEVLRTLEGVK